jgi:hypothetical protein
MLEQHKGHSHNLKICFSLENRKSILNGLSREQCGPYRFGLAPLFKKLTEAHPSVARSRGPNATPWFLQNSERSADCHQRAGPGPLSLSSAYEKEKGGRSFLPCHRFSPNTEVRPTSAHRWLAANWPGHWAIPFA